MLRLRWGRRASKDLTRPQSCLVEKEGPTLCTLPHHDSWFGLWDSREPLFTELSSAQGSKCHMYKQEVVRHTENAGCLNSGVHHTSASHFPIQVGVFQVVGW